jgi:hypothetical protein
LGVIPHRLRVITPALATFLIMFVGNAVGDGQIEALALQQRGQLAEFQGEQFTVPASLLGELVVGHHIGALLGWGEMRQPQDRDTAHLEELGRGNPTMARQDSIVLEGAEGSVTRTGARSQRSERRVRSGHSGRNQPGLYRLSPEGPKRAAGEEVALKGEGVVNRGMCAQEALS